MSIRTRLMIWYSALLFVVLLLFSSAIYAAMSFTLQRNVDSALTAAADDIQRRSIEILSGRSLTLDAIDSASSAIVLVVATDANGVAQINNFEDKAMQLQTQLREQRGLLNPSGLAVVGAQPARRRQPNIVGSRVGAARYRVLSVELTGEISGRSFGYLQVASNLTASEQAKQLLLFVLVMMGTLAMVISAAAGVAMAQRALAPVDAITQTVLEIYKAEDLNQRVPVQTNDEVGRMAGAFNGMLERLQNVFRSQQRLVADVSHELRTPLTVVRGNAELMRTFGRLDLEGVEAIIGEADRMTRMVGNLLLLSQADVGQLPMKVQVLDLGAMVNDVARSAQIMGAGKIEVTASACGDLIVQGDPDRIKQVLLNLVDNAIKHTPPGGKVGIVADCIEGQEVKLSVSDTGMGIPISDLPHVFERFYRVDKARSRDMGGAGLGLAIVKSIIDAHGGHIDVSSQVGQGTTFHVTLPAYQPAVL